MEHKISNQNGIGVEKNVQKMFPDVQLAAELRFLEACQFG
jgi:hypothetical protein